MTSSAPQRGESLPLVRTVAHCPDPTVLLAAAAEAFGEQGSLLLESADASAGSAGRSLIVARSALRVACRGAVVEISAQNPNGQALLPWLSQMLNDRAELISGEHSVRAAFPAFAGGDEDQRLVAPGPTDVLRLLSTQLSCSASRPEAMPILAGVFAYDFVDAFERLPSAASDPLGWPDFEFWLADRLVWLDHDRRNATVVTHLFGGDQASSAGGEAIAAMGPLLDVVERAQSRVVTASAVAPATQQVDVDLSDERYAELVVRCREHIVAGDVFQIVPSRTFCCACPDPVNTYRRLRALNPSPYMFYVNGSCGTLLGASPETALKIDGSPRRVHVRPIAGTRARGLRADGSIDEDLDSRLEAELRLDSKEVAEHMMLVDLARNDVARVSQPGSRWVDRLLHVERYSHVMHLVSHVSGTLREGLDALHAYVATMNMGTLVGAPKIKAAQLLRQFEATKRGPYGGAVGYLTADGRMDTAIVIRAAVVRDQWAYIRAGAGVVYDSDPMSEADETRRKASAVLKAIGVHVPPGGAV